MKNATKISALLATLALAATLGACSSTPEPAATTPAAANQDMSAPLEERIATPSEAQSKELLASLEKVNARLSDDRNITRAMSTCSDLLAGKENETVLRNAQIRYSGGDFEATTADAALIVEIVKTNGFCAAI